MLMSVSFAEMLAREIGVNREPVGIAFSRNSVTNAQMPRKVTFCELVSSAFRSGKVLAGNADTIECPLAVVALGLRVPDVTTLVEVVTSEQFGPFTLEFLDSLPRLSAGTLTTVIVGPLSQVAKARAVTFFAKTEQVIKAVTAWVLASGRGLHHVCQGIGSVCSESVAYSLLKGEPTVTAIPCIGASALEVFRPGEALFTLPSEAIAKLSRGLNLLSERYKGAEKLVISLLRGKKLTARELILKLKNLYPLCPDRPAEVLARMVRKGVVKQEISPERGGLVYFIEE